MINLPKAPIKVEEQDPRMFILFSKPKLGKTTALSALPNNLILDLENGTRYIESLKVLINSISDIKEVCKQIKEANYPYDFITIDTLTVLEDLCKPMALTMYKNTAAGAEFDGKDILSAPNGSGYAFLREALELVVSLVSKHAKNMILVCHSKDAVVDKTQINVKCIDLLGKTGRILSSKADAIGFLYRDDDSNTIITFNTNDKFIECGSRPAHLQNKEVVVGEMTDNGLEFHWDRIYPSLKK